MSLDAQLLTALRNSPDGLAAVDLAGRLGVSRDRVRALVAGLRAVGYAIESSPHRGYRLVGAPDALHADDILSRLGKVKVVGRDIRVFQETRSTNDIAEKLARDGVPEGVVVFAETQTKGRGRLGRKWVSPAGRGLWFTVLLRPPMRPQAATQLTVAAATALARAIRARTRLAPQIKWPNDLLLDGRKTAGILTEMTVERQAIHHLLLGIGVDVNIPAGEFPAELASIATSLQAELGRPVDRSALAARVLQELDRDYDRICTGRFDEVAEEWEQLSATIGREVVVRVGSRRIPGRAESLDPDGALLLRTQHGLLETIHGGEVTVEK